MTEPATAESALNLRAVLALFGLVLCTALAVASFVAGLEVLGLALAVLAVAAAVDLGVVQRRRHARGPGSTSLFE